MAEFNPMVPKSPADPGEAATPEDVATLYSWANLHGAKYRDFSASRAQAREEARLRVEEALAEQRRRDAEEAERKAQEEVQIAARLAAEAAEAARKAEAERLAEIARQAEAERNAVLAAQEAQRQAAQQRAWQPAPPEAYQGTLPPAFEGRSAFPEFDPYLASVAASEFSPDFNPGFAPTYGSVGGSAGGSIGGSVSGSASGSVSGSVSHPAQEPPANRAVSPAFPDPNALPREAGRIAHPSTNTPMAANFQSGVQTGVQAGVQAGANSGSTGSRLPSSPTPPAPPPPNLPPFAEAQAGRMYVAPADAFREYATPQSTGSQFLPESYLAPHHEPFLSSPWFTPEARDPREARELIAGPAWLAPELPLAPPPAPPPRPAGQNPPPNPYSEAPSQPAPSPTGPGNSRQTAQNRGQLSAESPYLSYSSQDPNRNPGQNPNPMPAPTPAQSPGPVEETPPGSRDRIANRWYALKGVFDPQAAPVEQTPAAPARVPVLAVFSLAGGVGKTSLVASLGRALSSRGERVLLVDTAAYGLLPFFFGARDQRPGMLRTFNPPGVSADAPIQLVTLDPESRPQEQPANPLHLESGTQPGMQSNAPAAGQDRLSQDWLAQEVGRHARSANRVLIDLPTASGATTRRVLRLAPVVLVPVMPDMNSVVSVGAIEAFFRNNAAVAGSVTGGKPIMPYYVLNQFDYSLPLHLDVREILREQIGDRLIPFALRRSPAVSEALAEGMTVMDYAPNAVVAEDYANLAGWVRSFSAPATQSYRGVRWSER